jgi:hypothetical protein
MTAIYTNDKYNDRAKNIEIEDNTLVIYLREVFYVNNIIIENVITYNLKIEKM